MHDRSSLLLANHAKRRVELVRITRHLAPRQALFLVQVSVDSFFTGLPVFPIKFLSPDGVGCAHLVDGEQLGIAPGSLVVQSGNLIRSQGEFRLNRRLIEYIEATI